MLFDWLVSAEHLLVSWNAFKRGKEGKRDVQAFACDLEENLLGLRDDLASGAYAHGGYVEFSVTDPKLRHIHKPSVRDRVVHHALTGFLTELYEPRFISDSYSSRKGKGTHAAVRRLHELCWRESLHDARPVWVLKCDVRRFFDSVDHAVLLAILGRRIRCPRTLALLEGVVSSFETAPGKGIPLGNLTSQVFSNIYLDRLDQFVKRELRVPCYLRYADDFALVSRDREYLVRALSGIRAYLEGELGLGLHERKITFRRWRQGVDFLGYVDFPHYALLRNRTRRRIVGKAAGRALLAREGVIGQEELDASLESYFGMLRHCRGDGVFRELDEALYALR